MPPIIDVLERRFIPLAAGAEIRAEGEGELARLSGVACPWDSLSVQLWRDWDTNKPVHERFTAGAFAEVLAAKPDVIIARDHDPSRLLGRTASGTASVVETSRGLEYWVDPPATEEGRSIVVMVRRGDVRGSSFAFLPATVDWTEEEERIIRTVRKVSLLHDCSPVTNPAYPESTATMSRSVEAMQKELNAWRSGDKAWRAALLNREARLVETGL
ncbi:MAG: HK97 family phage prohead protease [Thermoanaerobaculia bacterium]